MSQVMHNWPPMAVLFCGKGGGGRKVVQHATSSGAVLQAAECCRQGHHDCGVAREGESDAACDRLWRCAAGG